MRMRTGACASCVMRMTQTCCAPCCMLRVLLYRACATWLWALLCRYVDAALYLTELQSDGVLGAVGVTNFDVPRLEAMINKGAQIASNQVQPHLSTKHTTQRFQSPKHLSTTPDSHGFCLCILLQPGLADSADFSSPNQAVLIDYQDHDVVWWCAADSVLAAGPAARQRHGSLRAGAQHGAAAVRGCGRWFPV